MCVWWRVRVGAGTKHVRHVRIAQNWSHQRNENGERKWMKLYTKQVDGGGDEVRR